MALFQRKNKTTLAAEIVAEMQKAGMASTPLGGGAYNSAYAANEMSSAGQGIVTTVGQSVPMPRPGFVEGGGGFGAMLGPAAPLLPAPIDVVLDESGRALPRKYEYQTAINLNITQTEVPFQVLHSLVEQCDIIHRAIEIRVGDIIKQEGSWTLSDQAIATIMQEESCSHAKAALIGRERYGAEINRLRDFWENPYVASDRTFSEWLTESLWQVFTYDQWCIYPRYNFKGNVLGFDVIDAPTIKILLNNRGDIPSPPEPAYQQVLWGFPRGEFIASPDADGEFYSGTGRDKEFLTDQMSVFIKNRRTWSPYGYSPTEEAIPAASLYLNRQVWMNSEYQNGSMPMTFMKTNSQELDIHKLAEFERILNGRLTGNTAERHRIKVLPDGFDPVAMPEMADRFKSDYDEYIIKRVASIFGVSPAALGVVAKAGLGGGKGAQEGEAENVESVSTKPMEDYVVSVINSLSRRYLNADKNVTFVLNDRKGAREDLERSKALQTSLFSGQKTLNDVQGELGQNLYDMPEADEPFIVAGNAIQFLKGMLSVDTSGETVSQTETAVEASGDKPVDAQPPKPSPVGSEIPAVGAPADQKSAMIDELKDFGRFVKSRHKRGNWRAFDFTVFNAELADNLNEQAYFIVKGATPMPDNIYEWASDIVNSEITDTPKGLVTKRKVSDLPNYHALTVLEDQHRKAIQVALAQSITGAKAAVEQAVASAPPAGTDGSAIKMIVRQAVQHNIRVNTDKAMDALTALYEEAAAHGSNDALKTITMGKAGVTDGANMKSLLAKRDVTLKGISDTTISRISNTIAIGMDRGSSASDISVAVDLIINDAPRASIIAVTESNRAYNASAVDTYVEAGVKEFDWLAYDDACDDCASQEDANPHDVNDDVPPDHPNCRCTVAAVIGGESSSTPLPDASAEAQSAAIEGDQVNVDPLANPVLDRFNAGKPFSIEDAIKGTNPRYERGVEAYDSNCARCVQNFELRRRGYDVTANAYRNDLSQVQYNYIGSTWKDLEGKGAMLSKKYVANAKVRDTLIRDITGQNPEGARGFLQMGWKGRKVGHVINWEIKDGEVNFIDAQSGNIWDAGYRAWRQMSTPRWVRIDHLRPTDNVLRYIEGGK